MLGEESIHAGLGAIAADGPGHVTPQSLGRSLNHDGARSAASLIGLLCVLTAVAQELEP